MSRPSAEERLCRCFRDHPDLVDAVALPILSQPILRSVRAKFLSLLDRVSSPFSRSPFIDFGAADHGSTGGFRDLSPASFCLTSSTRSPRWVSLRLHGAGRLRGLHSLLRHHDGSPRADFFPEERWIIRQWQFQIGTLLGLFGAVGVFWFQPRWTAGHVSLSGLAIAFTASICWAFLRRSRETTIRRARQRSQLQCDQLSHVRNALPLTWIFGKIDTPLHASLHVN